jgi:NADH dehydrogenase
MNIVLVGGSGFLGQYLVRELVADGHRCTVLSRHTERRGPFRLEPGVRLKQADVYNPDELARHLENADAVVSMAGILNETGFGGQGFKRVHVDLTAALIKACKISGVERLVHVSALNAGKGKSHYLVSKGQAEELLRAEKGLQTTIFQPSVIFGRGDSFFNRFGTLLKFAPVMPLACGNSRIQPVFAGDVAAAIAASIGNSATYGKSFELGGPEVYTLKELVRFTAAKLGLKRWVFTLPDILSRIQGLVLGLVPGKPFSLDNYRSLQVHNVTSRNGLRNFGIVPVSIESKVPEYLGTSLRQSRLRDIRERARR